jgi:hypothetical protein
VEDASDDLGLLDPDDSDLPDLGLDAVPEVEDFLIAVPRPPVSHLAYHVLAFCYPYINTDVRSVEELTPSAPAVLGVSDMPTNKPVIQRK